MSLHSWLYSTQATMCENFQCVLLHFHATRSFLSVAFMNQWQMACFTIEHAYLYHIVNVDPITL